MYEKFDRFVTKLLNSTIATILIFLTGFTISASISYNILDFNYATDADFEPLYQIQETIINDFDAVYSLSNTNITLTTSNIIVYIFGDDCYLETRFNKDKVYESTEKIDKTDSVFSNISLMLAFSILGSILFYLIVAVTLAIITLTLRKLCKY